MKKKTLNERVEEMMAKNPTIKDFDDFYRKLDKPSMCYTCPYCINVGFLLPFWICNLYDYPISEEQMVYKGCPLEE